MKQTRSMLLVATALVVTLLSVSTVRAVNKAVREAEARRVELCQRLSQYTVAIFSPKATEGGSGVLVTSDGFALTNYHVVAGSEPWVKCGLADGKVYDAVVVGIDPTGDVALIKLLGRDDFPHATLGDSDQVRAGDTALALGNPFLLATDFQPTVTYGIISGVHRYQYPSGGFLEYADCLQTDAAVNPGNSGGPLFNGAGELIGINGRCSFEKRGRVNVGVAYAISINQIKKFYDALAGGRLMDHATLGATVDHDGQGRVIVARILESSDAYRRGVRKGDEIVQLAGRSVQTINGFKNILGTLPLDWRVPLVYRREGVSHEVLVRLRPIHTTGEIEMQMGQGRREQGPPPQGPDGKPDKPQGGPPDSDPKDPGAPQPQKPRRASGADEKLPLPEAVAALYEQRRGFINYHFNRARRDELCGRLRASVASLEQAGTWKLSGRLPEGTEVHFELEDAQAKAQLPLGKFEFKVSDNELDGTLAPPGSGGLLAALWSWRMLILRGADGFESLQYLGRMPRQQLSTDKLNTGKLNTDKVNTDKQHPSCDVLEGFSHGLTARFFLDVETAAVVGLEMLPDPDTDPCEITFTLGEGAGKALPVAMEVRSGDDVYGRVEQITLKMVAPGK